MQRQKKRVSLGAADPFALDTAFTHLESKALSADSRQTANSNCVALKRISVLLALDE